MGTQLRMRPGEFGVRVHVGVPGGEMGEIARSMGCAQTAVHTLDVAAGR